MGCKRTLVIAAATSAMAMALMPAAAGAATTPVGSCTIVTGITGGSCTVVVTPADIAASGQVCVINGTSLFMANCGIEGSVKVSGVVAGLVKGKTTVSGLTCVASPDCYAGTSASKSNSCGYALNSCTADTSALRPTIGLFDDPGFGYRNNVTVKCESKGSLGVTAVALTCTAYELPVN